MSTISKRIADLRKVTPSLYFERQEMCARSPNNDVTYTTFLKLTIWVNGTPYTETHEFPSAATDNAVCMILNTMHKDLCQEAISCLEKWASRCKDESTQKAQVAHTAEQEAQRLRSTM